VSEHGKFLLIAPGKDAPGCGVSLRRGRGVNLQRPRQNSSRPATTGAANAVRLALRLEALRRHGLDALRRRPATG